jgi:hypothetical protein
MTPNPAFEGDAPIRVIYFARDVFGAPLNLSVSLHKRAAAPAFP